MNGKYAARTKDYQRIKKTNLNGIYMNFVVRVAIKSSVIYETICVLSEFCSEMFCFDNFVVICSEMFWIDVTDLGWI